MTVDATAFWLTFKLACATTGILFVAGVPLAHWLATTRMPGRTLIETLVALPLVLPPTVLGFYLLLALGPRSPLGRLFEQATGTMLPFSFAGILLGSVLCNLPFAVRPFMAAFSSMNTRLLEASWCLGESRFRTFCRVTLPLSWPGILTGLVLAFAHTIGEFGVVLMIGGNIPAVTRTLSIAIYDDVQALNYQAAGRTALVLLAASVLALGATNLLNRRGRPA